MLSTTLSDFSKNLKKYMDQITEDLDMLIINRGKNKGVVIMSLEEYNSLNATQLELSSKKNENRLDNAIDKLRNGSSFSKQLLEE